MNELIGQDGEIISGLRADVMRSSIENKNLLKKKGSLYVGTGSTTTIQAGSVSYSIPITEELAVGENENHSVLVVKNANNGVGYSKIYPSMVEENSEEWNITCKNANHVENSYRARYVTYASSDHSKGTIDERLSQMEAIENRTCNVTYQIETSSGEQGNITVNRITKAFNTVIMKLKIEGLVLNSNGYLIDSLNISLPDGYRPKRCPTIFATIGAMIETKVVIQGITYVDLQQAPCTVPIKIIRPNTSIHIDANIINDYRTKVEDNNNHASNYKVCGTFEIQAVWNIEEPTIDICLATDNTSNTTKIWVRLGMVKEAKVSKIRLYRVGKSYNGNWSTYETDELVDEIPGYYSPIENIKYASFTVPRYSDGSYCKAELIYKSGVNNICTGEVYIEK